MLTRPARTQSKIHMRVAPLSSAIGTVTRAAGADEGLFDGEGERGGADEGCADLSAAGGTVDVGCGGPEARRVSLDTPARGSNDAASSIAGIVTANASVPGGDVANAAGLSDATSSGRARACRIAALRADADG